MRLGIIVGIIIGIVILGAVAAILLLTVGNQTSPASPTGATPVNANPANSPTAKSSLSPTSSPLLSQTPSFSPRTPTSSAAVNFVPSITGVSGSDLNSRTITAQIANTGTADAHNVQAKVEINSQGTPIQLNGQPYLTQSFGTIKAGATVTLQYQVTVSFSDALKILQNGATIILNISSDEKTQTTSYDYHP